MKVLVTGATGRVGGEVVKTPLQRGADVWALTRKQPIPGAAAAHYRQQIEKGLVGATNY